jgi:DNA repair and recombination protein RAD54B
VELRRRKYTTKKNKTWEGDGVLAVYGGYAHLRDSDGREMGKCMFRDPLLPGSTLSVGGKDIEIEAIIPKDDFIRGKHLLNATKSERKSTPSTGESVQKITLNASKGKPLFSMKKSKEDEGGLEIPTKSFYTSHKTDAMKSHFKNPMLASTIMTQNKDGSGPRHDPDAKGSLVMKRPRDCPMGKDIVDVVVDPFIGKHLREHQREGVMFLYECVMGMRDFNGNGALLADEMGLGKTLQTIALLWTLLKQNPYHVHGSNGPANGIIKKALIVCPVTLIVNWKKEFNKWLGNERIGVFVVDGSNKKVDLAAFTHGKSYSVMIIGYEKLRSVQDELKKGDGIDIVIADEGHRLKTAQNKSAEAIRSLNTERRIILSGTPLQNDLSEFFTMVDFINPGMLGTYKSFKKEFETPILKSRQPGASARDLEIGTGREEELSLATKQSILRRTAEILSKYLPPKSEYVLFCKPTRAQAQVYQHVLESPAFGKILGGNTESALALITVLKKVCNAPSLLVRKGQDVETNPNIMQLLDIIPSELLQKKPVMASSKFRVLDRLLKQLSKTDEKIVIVSNYTSTLDILSQHLTTMSLPYLRLDGSTLSTKRQALVDTFNRTPASKNFAFLLSAKSGGAGINLIGASRLVLFDVDWNPATDLQAMARIHRDGQKRPVKIYRFLMAGGMDEKIYQRQVTKMGLADSVVDGKKNESSFSAEELRDLFRLDMEAGCQTHDLLGCDCKGLGVHPIASPIEIIDSDEEAGDSDDEFPDLLFPMPATVKNVAAFEKKLMFAEEKKKASKMQALMRYAHLDTSIFAEGAEDVFGYEREEISHAKTVLGDEILFEVLKDERCKVDYVFAKNG